MSKLTGIALVAGLIVAGLSLACSGGNDSKASSAPTVAPTAEVAQPQVINLADVENGDAYSFSPNALKAKPGVVTVHYTNPAGSARNHTFQVKSLDGASDVVKSDQVKPGETVDLTFTVTAEGTYQFLCYQRGHADRGQTGTLVVSKAPLG